MTLLRRAAFVIAVVLSGCAQEDLTRAPAPLGNFELGYNIAIAKNAKAVGPSRQASPEELETAVEAAIAERIGRYQGGKLYHLGVGIDAYALAVPGIPVVLSPKSVLAITVNVWDDTAQRIINAEPKQFTVFESLSGATIIGSGLVKSREEQLATLSRNAARQIDDWLIDNKAWFTPEAAAARAVLGPSPNAPAARQAAAAATATTTAAPPATAQAKPAPAKPTPLMPPKLPPAPPGKTIGLP